MDNIRSSLVDAHILVILCAYRLKKAGGVERLQQEIRENESGMDVDA